MEEGDQALKDVNSRMTNILLKGGLSRISETEKKGDENQELQNSENNLNRRGRNAPVFLLYFVA